MGVGDVGSGGIGFSVIVIGCRLAWELIIVAGRFWNSPAFNGDILADKGWLFGLESASSMFGCDWPTGLPIRDGPKPGDNIAKLGLKITAEPNGRGSLTEFDLFRDIICDWGWLDEPKLGGLAKSLMLTDLGALKPCATGGGGAIGGIFAGRPLTDGLRDRVANSGAA